MGKIKVAVDMTWIRHEKVGGTEVYTVNLVEGFASVKERGIAYYLLVPSNHYDIFSKYNKYKNIKVIRCKADSGNKAGRVLWQNLYLSQLLQKLGISICIEPVYLKPVIHAKGIRFITAIHDFQAAHYPEYFSLARVCWMKAAWGHAVRASEKVVVTSEFVKNDLLNKYQVGQDKIVVNYDPVTIDKKELAPEGRLAHYGAAKGEYYYMCASMLPHENIETVLKALGRLKRLHSDAFYPLFISGIGGKREALIRQEAYKNGIADKLHLLPFVPDGERNLFYKNCRAFLAPSLFEGFGMPPIEAMIMGAPVVTTMETCSYEITGGLAVYVKEAKNVGQWCGALKGHLAPPDNAKVQELADKYSKENVAACYNRLIKEIY